MGCNLLHVYLDGVAAQEVFNLDGTDTAARNAVSLPVFSDVRRQEDVDVFLDEAVHYVRGLDLFRLGGRDDHCLDVVPADIIQEFVIVHVDVYAHHHLAAHGRVIGHETPEVEFVLLVHADGLGNVHAYLLGAINEGVVSFFAVLVEGVVEHLDCHSQGGHEQEGHHIGNHEAGNGGQLIPHGILENHGRDDGHAVSYCEGHEYMHHVRE